MKSYILPTLPLIHVSHFKLSLRPSISPSTSQSNFRYHLQGVWDLLPATRAATLHLFLFMDATRKSQCTHFLSLSHSLFPLPPYRSAHPIRLSRLRESHSQDTASRSIWAAVEVWIRNGTSVQPADDDDGGKKHIWLDVFVCLFFCEKIVTMYRLATKQIKKMTAVTSISH